MGEVKGKYFLHNRNIISSEYVSEYSILKDNSVYEVIRIIDGIPLFLEDHFYRFISSILSNKKKIDMDVNDFKDGIMQVVEANEAKTGNIKIVYNINNFDFFIYFIEHYYPSKELYNEGVDVSLLKLKRDDPNVKLIKNYYKKITKEYREKTNTYEVILFDDYGYISEGSRSNIFFIKDNKLYTSPRKKVLLGITLQKVYEICENLGIEVNEITINKNNLPRFESVFLTGTSTKILPVKHIETEKFDVNNGVLKTLIKEYDYIVNDYKNSFK